MSLSDFKILHKLGTGAYSSVYKVQRILDGNLYALKKVNLFNMNEKEKNNSLNQVRILASIRHDNVIGYKEAFLDQGTKSLCIVMEFAEEGDLYERICAKKQNKDGKEGKEGKEGFQENQIWNVFIQIVRALKCLHQRKILHRDLKSANVFICKDGKVKLGDMNVSKISEKGLCLTQTGTPYYASPQVWKDEPYGPKSDIWSLGCVIYEMAMLRPPFQADDMQGLYKRVCKGQYPKLSSKYSSDLSTLIAYMLQTDQHKRPSCQKLLNMKMISKHMTPLSKQTHYENPQFLQTIRMPKDIYFLTEHLPKPNYFTPKKISHPVENQSKPRIASTKTEKYHKKQMIQDKYTKLFPRVSQVNVRKNVGSGIQGFDRENKQNRSLLLKNAEIIGAARNQVNGGRKEEKIEKGEKVQNEKGGKAGQIKNYVIANKNIQQLKVRDRRIKKQKLKEQLLSNINSSTNAQKQTARKQLKTIDMQSKLQSIHKIYHNGSTLMKK